MEKININKTISLLFEMTLMFLLLQHNVFPSELTFISLLLTIVIGFLMIFKGNKAYLNPFIITYLIFLLYATIDTVFRGNIKENIQVLIMYFMELLSSFCIYNYLIKNKKIERFFNIYILISVISLTTIFALLGKNALSTRLGHNGAGGTVSYYIFNTPIFKSSNGTANFCAIATFFLLYYAQTKQKKWCYIPVIFLTVGLLLCGSRKGILSFGIYIIYTCFFMKKGINTKKVLMFFLVPIITYLAIMKIPVVYNAIGQRIESMVLNVFNISNDLDQNSYAMRQNLKSDALEWIKEQPIFGYGLRTFSNELGYGAENNVLQLMIDFGIIGTIIYYAFLPSLLYEIVKLKNKSVKAKVLGVIVLTILLQDYGSVTYSWQHMTMWYSIFWAVIRLEKNKNILQNIQITERNNDYEK